MEDEYLDMIQGMANTPDPAQNYDQEMTSDYDAEMVDLVKSIAQNPFSNNTRLISGKFKESRYLNKFDDPRDYDEINEKLASRQPGLHKFGAGVGRVLNKAVSELAKLPGVAVGITAGGLGQVADGLTGKDETDFMEVAFNNPWIEGVNHLSEKVNEEILPAYVSKAVKDGNLWDKISSLDFWATDGADGLGYILSMLVPGQLINKFDVGAKLVGGSKWLKLANKTDDAAKQLTKLGITPKQANLHTGTLANTIFEAGVEAQGAMDTYIQEMTDRYANGEITFEELQESKKDASKIGRNVFTANAAILLGPNAIMSKMLWGGANKGRGNLFNRLKEAQQKSTASLKKAAAKEIYRGFDAYGKAFAREGFWEEGMQSTVEQYFTENPDADLFSKKTIGDLPEAYAKMIADGDGQAAIFLGGAFGGTMQAVAESKKRKTDLASGRSLYEQLESTVNSLDNLFGADVYQKTPKLGKVKIKKGKPIKDPNAVLEKLKAMQGFEGIAEEYEDALADNNTILMERLENIALTAIVKPFVYNNRLGEDALNAWIESNEALIPSMEKENININETKSRIKELARRMTEAHNTFESFFDESVNIKGLGTPEEVIAFRNKLSNNYLNNTSDAIFFEEEVNKLKKELNRRAKKKGILTEEEALESDDRFLAGLSQRIKLAEKILKGLSKDLEATWDQDQVEKTFKRLKKESEEFLKRMEKEEKVDEELKKTKEAKTTKELNELEETAEEDSKPAIREKKKDLQAEKETKAKSVTQKEVNKKNQEKAIIEALNYSPRNSGEKLMVNDIEVTVLKAEGKKVKYTYELDGDTITTVSLIRGIEKATPAKEQPKKTPRPSETNKQASSIKIAPAIYNNKEGLLLDWVDPSVELYLRAPINNKDEKFDIVPYVDKYGKNLNSERVNKIMDNIINDPNFIPTQEEKNILIDNLGIGISFGYENDLDSIPVMAPIRARSKKDGPDSIYFKKERILRENIVNAIIQNKGFEGITVTAVDQLQGVINSTGNPDVFSIKTMPGYEKKLSPTDIYVKSGESRASNIKDTQIPVIGKTEGKFFIQIKTPGGKLFPYRLNEKEVTAAQKDLLFDLFSRYGEQMTKKTYPKLSEIDSELLAKMKRVLPAEFEFFKNNGQKRDNQITIKDVVDMLIFDETNKKNVSQASIKFQIKEGQPQLYMMGKWLDTATMTKEEFMDAFKTKRRHVSLKQKKNSPKSIGLNNPAYFKFIVDNNILGHNLVINEPAFKAGWIKDNNDKMKWAPPIILFGSDTVEIKGKKIDNTSPVEKMSTPPREVKPKKEPIIEQKKQKKVEATITEKPASKGAKVYIMQDSDFAAIQDAMASDRVLRFYDSKNKKSVYVSLGDYYMWTMENGKISAITSLSDIRNTAERVQGANPFASIDMEKLMQIWGKRYDSQLSNSEELDLTEEEAEAAMKKIFTSLTSPNLRKNLGFIGNKAKAQNWTKKKTLEEFIEYLRDTNIAREYIKEICGV